MLVVRENIIKIGEVVCKGCWIIHLPGYARRQIADSLGRIAGE